MEVGGRDRGASPALIDDSRAIEAVFDDLNHGALSILGHARTHASPQLSPCTPGQDPCHVYGPRLMATLFNPSGPGGTEDDCLSDWRDGNSLLRIAWQDELGNEHQLEEPY